MPLLNRNAEAALRGDKHQTSGRMTVKYVDAQKRSRSALVLGPGTDSGLRLQLADISRTILDNVPAATGLLDTEVYVSRL